MADKTPQTFENHSRIFPAYHYVAVPLIAINWFNAVYQAVIRHTWDDGVALVLATALVLLVFVARIMVLTVQDRVIRLEERLRMREVLPADLKPRINEFTTKQLVALRFASDAELPELARQVLEGKLTEQKAIKQAVKNWRADYLRA